MSETNTEIRTQVIQIPRAKPDDPIMECYQAFPNEEGPFPGIIVIHEILGLNDNIRDIVSRLIFGGQPCDLLDADFLCAFNPPD